MFLIKYWVLIILLLLFSVFSVSPPLPLCFISHNIFVPFFPQPFLVSVLFNFNCSTPFDFGPWENEFAQGWSDIFCIWRVKKQTLKIERPVPPYLQLTSNDFKQNSEGRKIIRLLSSSFFCFICFERKIDFERRPFSETFHFGFSKSNLRISLMTQYEFNLCN